MCTCVFFGGFFFWLFSATSKPSFLENNYLKQESLFTREDIVFFAKPNSLITKKREEN